MSRTIAQRELRNDNARVIDAVAAGESFVVTRNGTVVARIVPVEKERRRTVSRSDLRTAIESGLRIDAALFRADLDAALDQGLPR